MVQPLVSSLSHLRRLNILSTSSAGQLVACVWEANLQVRVGLSIPVFSFFWLNRRTKSR